MRASDYRKQAWSALSGKWGISILASLVASLLCGTSALVSTVSANFDINVGFASPSDLSAVFSSAEQETWIIIVVMAMVICLVAVVVAVTFIISAAMFCIGSIIEIGYSRFNLNIIDNKNLKFTQIFSYFKHWWRAILANLLRSLFISLWSLLFIIPGVIATYRYSMVPFILSDNPDMSPTEAVEYSKHIMHGNKWRLFCLMFSFIGWDILCALTFGVLNILVIPYKHVALAAFYRSINPTSTSEIYTAPIDDTTDYI